MMAKNDYYLNCFWCMAINLELKWGISDNFTLPGNAIQNHTQIMRGRFVESLYMSNRGSMCMLENYPSWHMLYCSIFEWTFSLFAFISLKAVQNANWRDAGRESTWTGKIYKMSLVSCHRQGCMIPPSSSLPHPLINCDEPFLHCHFNWLDLLSLWWHDIS